LPRRRTFARERNRKEVASKRGRERKRGVENKNGELVCFQTKNALPTSTKR